jgi:RNA polymerase sigma-70 factor (ECF subfamily)
MELLMSRAPESQAGAEAIEIEALVRRTLEGDFGAFEQWVLRHERRVLTLSLRILRDLADAQDATQEVFLRAFRFLHRLDAQRPAVPWLMRITINVCRDIHRKKQHRAANVSEIASIDAVMTNDSSDPHLEFAVEQRRQMLWKALDGLPEKERMALILRDVEGLSTAETATILGSSEATVRSQICRGRLKLKDALESMRGGQS